MGAGDTDGEHTRELGISVVMPYFANERTVRASVEGYAAQCAELSEEVGGAELVIVDDGSPAPARPLLGECTLPVPVHVVRQANLGQSAATNAAVARSRGRVLVLSCADILPRPDLLRAHLEAHRKASGRVAVMGHIAYAPHVERTPFIEFLANEQGPQFSFAKIVDRDAVNPAMLYAPNLSLERAAWEAVGGFDEQFTYGFQDTDLGYRLADIGTRLIYRADACVYHDHPTTLRAFVARQRRVGASYWRLLDKHPTRTTPLAQVRASLTSHLPRLPQLPRLLDAANALEAAIPAGGPVPTPVRERLERAYTLALQLALVDGLAQDAARLQALFGGAARVPGRIRSA